MEWTPRKLAKGTREEVTELVVDAPVDQALLESQVHVSPRFPSVEQIVDVPVPQERIVQKDAPQDIEQLTELTMRSSQDRILQSTKKQILEVSHAADDEAVGSGARDFKTTRFSRAPWSKF